ncbi:MAG TPA: hypothetical protein VNQ79_08035 [Blastocatellia bacterium]|nr:hypothetical protein [Blastocatellia bacterium]
MIRLRIIFSILLILAVFVIARPFEASMQRRGPARPQTKPKPAALTNQDVIKLAQAKLSDDLIIAKIRQSKTNFDLSTDGLLQLKNAGVSDRVLKVMMNPAAEPEAPAQPEKTAVAPAARSRTTNETATPAKPPTQTVEQPAPEPVHKVLENVAAGKPGATLIRPKPTPPPRPPAAIRSAPQNYGMYVEVNGQLKPIGRIQTKVQHSKWRSLLASRVPFVRQKIDINIPGAHSDSRFEAQRPAFYAFFPPSRDVSKFKLIHCKITGQGFDQRTVSNLSIMFSREQNQDEILCDIGPTEHKDLYRIMPREDLPSGEYSFVEGNPGAQAATNVDIIDVWDFGVDLKDDKLGVSEYLDKFSLVSKGDVAFLGWSKDEAQKIVDAHAGSEDVRGSLQGWFKRQFATLGVYWVDEQFARAFARLEMLDRNLTPEQATKLAALLMDVDQNNYYVMVTLGQKIGSGKLIGANEAERRMRPFDAVLYNAKDDDFIVPAKKMEGLGGYAAVWKVTFDRSAVKGSLLSAGPEVYFEARLNQNLDLKVKFKSEQITSKLAMLTR